MGYGCKVVLEEGIGYMSPDMFLFWETFYEKIILEYLHFNKSISRIVLENRTSPNHSIVSNQDMCAQSSKNVLHSASKKRNLAPLVPIGGGKDSLVVWHMSTRSDGGSAAGDGQDECEPPQLLYVADGLTEFEESWRLKAVCSEAGGRLHLVRHVIQNENFQRTAKSFLVPCGHPWAALVLFDAVLVSQLHGLGEVRLGWERSADHGNGTFIGGVEVNHQFDKSSSFLASAQQYVHHCLRADVRVWSPICHLWDLEVARLFSREQALQRFHRLFISCNEPTPNGDWCLKCEKCAFVYLILSAWMSPAEVLSVFGQSLFDRIELLPIFLRLLGADGVKPFECVGTFSEASAAVELTVLQHHLQHFYHSQSEARLQAPLQTTTCSECVRVEVSGGDDGEHEHEQVICTPPPPSGETGCRVGALTLYSLSDSYDVANNSLTLPLVLAQLWKFLSSREADRPESTVFDGFGRECGGYREVVEDAILHKWLCEPHGVD